MRPPLILLATASVDDATAFAGVHRRCFDEVWDAQAFSRLLGEPSALGVAARANGAVIGFGLCRIAADEAELLSCGVAPEFRGLGIARRLLDRALGEARSRGVRSILLEVAEDNARARGLYASLRFHPIGRRLRYYRRVNNQPVDALTMRLDL